MVQQSWADEQQRRVKRRRLQIAAGCVALLVAAAFVGAFNVGGAQDRIGQAVGYEAPDETVDTSPFEPARPQVTGATTLPDAVVGAGDPFGSPTTSTSTTLPEIDVDPVKLEIQAPKLDEGACGLYRMVRSFATLTDLPRDVLRATLTAPSAPGSPVSVADRVRALLTAYQAQAPASLKPAVQSIRETYTQMFDTVERNDYDQTRPELAKLVDDVTKGRGKFAKFLESVQVLGEYDFREC